MKKRWIALGLCLALLLTGCTGPEKPVDKPTDGKVPETQGSVGDLGGDSQGFGEALEELGVYEGYFEEDSKDITVECVSGTANAYTLEGSTLTFTGVSEETVYTLSGTFRGNIVIDVGDAHKFDLELNGFSLVCDSVNPITILSGDEVTVKAKKDTQNYIYDQRPAGEEGQYSGAIHAEVDLKIAGKGQLTLVSQNNNGIHTKDDLQVKNLTLLVACQDNALKGNDSVTLTDCNTTLIAAAGDGIKTGNSDISQKGNQRGTVTVSGGSHTIYAACDGIDAAYNAVIEGETTELNIYTDKYSNYSQEVTATSSDTNFIRFTSDQYFYSVRYYNTEEDFVWVNATYHSKVSGGRSSYYYYSYPKMPEYAKQQFFIYDAEAKLGQDQDFLVKSEILTPNAGCDTFSLTNSYNGLYFEWTNYTTKIQEGGFGGGPGGPGGGPGGPGGMGDGNTDKGDHSTKGIKAANEILIRSGSVNIKSYDDAIHANKDTALENGETPLGNVTVLGGTVTVYSSDDGLHADGVLSVEGGTVTVVNAYEGMEGNQVQISGGYISINCKDDGINATATADTAVSISGGTLYIYCTGDGIDSNSRTAGVGIVFSGGRTVVISNSGMNSAIDTENGYTYTGGAVVAVMPRGGMSGEATNCSNFSSIGKSAQMSLTEGGYLTVGIGSEKVTVRMPVSLSGMVIVLGSNAATAQTEAATTLALDGNGVCWE